MRDEPVQGPDFDPAGQLPSGPVPTGPLPTADSADLVDPSAVDSSARPAKARHRTFASILVNTAFANVTTSYLWFAITFWIYDETRNVIATGVIGGAFMLLIALTSISFGTFVDRFRKLSVMRFAGGFTLVMFTLAGIVFFLTSIEAMLEIRQPWFWLFSITALIGAVVENMRNVALSTVVTILIDPDTRANANGYVGMVQGLAFIVTSVFSGLSIGLLGMGPTVIIAIVLTAIVFFHLLFLRMPEEVRPAATDAHGGFDLRGSWLAVMAIPGLFALIIFSTFNNFVGGVYMALLDPYGIELFTVQWWGVWFAVAATGFLVGGALVGKFGLGKNPLRTLLLVVIVMGLTGALFSIREWGWLLVVGIWFYMLLVPAIEAAEQTIIQRVVPLERQGRVFGFAGAFEAAAAPITAFLIAPIAEAWIIPFARGERGARILEPLLGAGDARGIALVFLAAGCIMVIAATAALFTPVYRKVSAVYARQDAGAAEGESLEHPNQE